MRMREGVVMESTENTETMVESTMKDIMMNTVMKAEATEAINEVDQSSYSSGYLFARATLD